MEDFDIFTDQIEFTKPVYKNMLQILCNECPSTPIGPNYQSGRKLSAEECLAENLDLECAFHLSEAVSTSIRMLATYRDEQIKAGDNKMQKILSYLKPVNNLKQLPVSKSEEKTLDLFSPDMEAITDTLSRHHIEDLLPFHKEYLKFTDTNNVDNFQKILRELPKEWTIIQLTAPYNPNENLKPVKEYREEIDSIYLSVFANDYVDEVGPFTVKIPANVIKEGEKPLFTEFYSLLEENYNTIDNAQFLNNKRCVQNYWNRREDIDLRITSVLNVMDKYWLGGWGCLLTGKLMDTSWKSRVKQLVDNTIADWGFIRLTKKQRVLLYNLIESTSLNSQQIKSCIRRILTEHGNPEDIRQVVTPCGDCSKDFKFVQELCLKCLSKCFEGIHKFSLVDGIRAFSEVATEVKEADGWAGLKKAKRHPVILIVDEMLDTFPWETLPILKNHPVSRIENIHFLYYLYKIHETDIVDGYFETKGDVGRYVINPEKNLDRMELRMRSFVQYWCDTWRGHVAAPPPPEDFIHYLKDADVFLYCGHGDGCQFANGGSNGKGVEAATGAKAICILSGCGSVRLVHEAGRAPPTAAHRRLHIAGCPSVVGMLWEVTDLEVDKVVSTLLALWVPSGATVPWHAVGKGKWSQGELDTSVEQKTPFAPERDLLVAIARSRGSSNFVMIASSVVVRGLPARIRDP